MCPVLASASHTSRSVPPQTPSLACDLMSAEQPSYSTLTLHRPPSKDSNFQVDVENDWDLLAEAIVGSDSQPNVQLDQLVAVLESHGVVVHRFPTPQPATPSVSCSPFITELTTSGTTPSKASKETNPNVCPSVAPNTRQLSLFPQNVALVYGTRVIEAPLSQPPENSHQPERIDALFKLLETAGAEVVRWPAATAHDDGKGTTPEGQLVDIEESSEQVDKEEEGPRFSPCVHAFLLMRKRYTDPGISSRHTHSLAHSPRHTLVTIYQQQGT